MGKPRIKSPRAAFYAGRAQRKLRDVLAVCVALKDAGFDSSSNPM